MWIGNSNLNRKFEAIEMYRQVAIYHSSGKIVDPLREKEVELLHDSVSSNPISG